MNIVIKEVCSKRELKKFVKFQYGIYKNYPNFVPPLYIDELNTFSKDKNPAFELSDARLLLAYLDGKVAGRIVLINNKPANKKWKTKNLRFGWFECIENYDVAKALFDEAVLWAKQLGMETITGPHGFCDFDPQGLLIEGYDKLATIASYYHPPYYREYVERYGFEKDVDYIEFLSTLTDYKPPQVLLDLEKRILSRANFKLLKYDSVAQYKKRAPELFQLIEETFQDNYGTVPLSEKQVKYYTKKYISYIHKDLIKIIVDENDVMIGFIITMPNLSKAMQKANGKLLPFGLFHILRAMKKNDVLDFYFAGVKKEYRGKGVDVVLTVEVASSAGEFGIKFAESNQELEHNSRVQSEWKHYNPVQHKRRRIYKIKVL
jgi:hypothetical protein